MSDTIRKVRKKAAPKKRELAQKPRVPKAPAKPVGVIVLGMHRSGTSALSGLLNLLGCTLPAELIPGNPTNEKGHFESIAIRDLMDQALDTAASHWDDWLPISEGWFNSALAEDFQATAVELLAQEYGSSRLFTIKNPRICRLVPFWNNVWDAAGVDARFVLIHRNPIEVAASLEKRNGIDPQLGMLIWLRHVLAAEADTRDRARSFTSYTHLLQNWQRTAEKLQSDLKLSFPRFSLGVTEDVEAFLSPSLRHHNDTSNTSLNSPIVSSWVRDVCTIMDRWSEHGENKKDYAPLDEILAAFNASAPTFARLIDTSNRFLIENTQAKDDLIKKNQEQMALQAVLVRMEDRVKSYHEEIDTSAITVRDLRLHTNKMQSAAQTKEATLLAQIEELKHEAVQTQRRLQQYSFESDEEKRASEQLRQQKVEALKALETHHVQAEAALHDMQHAFEKSKETLTQTSAKLEQANQKITEADAARGSFESQKVDTDLTLATLQSKLEQNNLERISTQEETAIAAAQTEDLRAQLGTAQEELKIIEAERAQIIQKLNIRHDEIEIITRNTLTLGDSITHLHREITKKDEAILSQEQKAHLFLCEITSEQEASKTMQTALQDELSQTQSALRQRSHEASETAKDLKQVVAQLADYKDFVSQLESTVTETESHAERMHAKLIVKQDTNARDQQDRFDEVATLTQQLIEQGTALAEARRLEQSAGERHLRLVSRLEVSQRLSVRVMDALDIILDSKKIVRYRLPILANRRKARLIEALGLFDRHWYTSVNTDVRDAGVDPALHFVCYGYSEGRAPSLEVEQNKHENPKS